MYKDVLCTIALDSLVFAGTKFTLHKILDSSYFMQVDGMDIFAFFIADGAYYLLFKNMTAGYFTSFGLYQQFILKYGSIIVGVAVLDLLMGDKNRMISNLINIGASGAVNGGLHMILPSLSFSSGTSAPAGSMPV